MHDVRRGPDYLTDICAAMRRMAHYAEEMTEALAAHRFDGFSYGANCGV